MKGTMWLCGGALAALSASAAFAQTPSPSPVPAPTPDAAAPNATTPEPSGLEDIVVTARRVEENQQRVPIAITTLSGAALQRRNVGQVSDLQYNAANFQIKPSNTYPTVPEFIIRGQRQQLFTDENVVTYVNDVPQNTRGLTLYDLDSVQVLKGPQGTLFGKNSNGGAVIFTTKKPTFDFGGNASFEYGNYDERNFTGVINIPIVNDKVALRVAGNIERRDGVFKNVYPGAKDAGNRHVESGRTTLLLKPTERLESQFTFDIIHRNEIPTPEVIEAAATTAPGFAGLVSLLTQQAVAQQSALGGGTATIENGLLTRHGSPFVISQPTGAGTTIPTAAFGGHYNPVAGLVGNVKAWGIQNTTKYELSDTLTLRNILGYRDTRSLDEQDPAGVAGFTVNIAPVLTALGAQGLPPYFPGQLVDNNTNFTNRYRTFTEEVQLIAKLDNLDLIVGGFYSHEKFNYSVSSNFTIGPVDLYQVGPRYADEDLRTNSRALFAQGTYDFSSAGLEGLKVTAGVRYTWDGRNYDGTNFFTNGNNSLHQSFGPGDFCNELNGTGATATGVNDGTNCTIAAKKTYRAPTWTGSINYQAARDTLLYLTTRRGFKSGSANPTTANLDYTLYGSEKLTDYEVGLKQQGRLGDVPYRFNIAGFVGKYKNIQTQDILSFCANAACSATFTDLIIFNVGQATIKGVEIDSSIKPFPALTIDVGYSYQVAKYGKGSVIPQPDQAGPVGPANPIDFNTGVNLSGVNFPGIARHNLNVAGSLALGFVPESFAKTVLSVNYAYRSHTTGAEALGVYKAAGFSLVNGRLAFEDLFGSHISAAAWVRNLTKERYRLGCADNLNSLGYATCRFGDPRTYGGSLSVTF